jgi:hypothetical protein
VTIDHLEEDFAKSGSYKPKKQKVQIFIHPSIVLIAAQ